MNIAITSPSPHSLFVSTLTNVLIQEGHRPKCMLFVRKSRGVELLKSVKETGYLATFGRLFRYYKIAHSKTKSKDLHYYLGKYSRSHNINNWDMPIPEICRKEGIPCIRIDNANSDRTIGYLKSMDIDILIYGGGGGILRKNIINTPRTGILLAHKGPLPAYRGTGCVEWPLFYGDRVGVTVIFLDEGIDTGDIILSRDASIEPGDTLASLYDKLEVTRIELLAASVTLLADDSVKRAKQSPDNGKQYFAMHPRLKRYVEKNLQRYDYIV